MVLISDVGSIPTVSTIFISFITTVRDAHSPTTQERRRGKKAAGSRLSNQQVHPRRRDARDYGRRRRSWRFAPRRGALNCHGARKRFGACVAASQSARRQTHGLRAFPLSKRKGSAQKQGQVTPNRSESRPLVRTHRQARHGCARAASAGVFEARRQGQG